MKKIMMTMMMTAFLFSSLAFAAEEQKVNVRGMVCSFCAQGITKKFKEQPEVADIEVNLTDKFVRITYKDGQKLSEEKITTLLKEAGYDVTFNNTK